MEFYTQEMRAAERLDTEEEMHSHFEQIYVDPFEKHSNQSDTKQNTNIKVSVLNLRNLTKLGKPTVIL